MAKKLCRGHWTQGLEMILGLHKNLRRKQESQGGAEMPQWKQTVERLLLALKMDRRWAREMEDWEIGPSGPFLRRAWQLEPDNSALSVCWHAQRMMKIFCVKPVSLRLFVMAIANREIQRKWMQRFNCVLNCTLIAATIKSPAWGGREEKPGGPLGLLLVLLRGKLFINIILFCFLKCWGPRTKDVLGRHYYPTVLPTLHVHQKHKQNWSQMWCWTFNPCAGDRGRQIPVSSRTAWSTRWVPGEPRLLSETLIQTKHIKGIPGKVAHNSFLALGGGCKAGRSWL